MTSLFVGRFQPFHLGHLKSIEYVLRLADDLVIGVGSARQKNTLENPFSYGERVEMIESSLKCDKSRFVVKPIPDFGDEGKWVSHILENFPKFDVVYSNAPREKKIFRNAHVQVRSVPLYDRTLYNGSEIRRNISSGQRWENLVPKETAEIIKRVGGVKRITELALK